MLRPFLITSFLLASLYNPISAHHSFPASYEMQQTVVLDGIVEGWLWRNPHPFIFLKVKDDSGKEVTWHVEFANATAMAPTGSTISPASRAA